MRVHTQGRKIFLITTPFYSLPFEIDINGKCEILSPTSICNTTLNYTSIYIPSYTTQLKIEFEVSRNISFLNFTTPSCKNDGTQFFCLSAFPFCNQLTFTTPPINIPSQVCYSSCRLAEESCSLFIPIVYPTFTCKSNNSQGNPEYPEETSNYNLTPFQGPEDFQLQCNSNSRKGDGNSTIECKEPLLYISEEEEKSDGLYYFVLGRCALPCPFKIWKQSEVDSIMIIKKVLYSLSFIGAILLIVTFGIIPNEISPKMESIVSFSIGTIFLDISFFIENHDKNFICSSDRSRYKVQSDVSCGFNGFVFQFGALVSIFWWTMLCFDLFLTVRMKKNIYFKYLRIIVWTISILSSIIPLMGKVYASTVATTGCWLGEKLKDYVQCLYDPLTTSHEQCPLVVHGFSIRLLQVICIADVGFLGFLAYGLDFYALTVWQESKLVGNLLALIGISKISNSHSSSSNETRSSVKLKQQSQQQQNRSNTSSTLSVSNPDSTKTINNSV
eukprot:gene9634-11810_t